MTDSLNTERMAGSYKLGSFIFDISNSFLQKGDSRFNLTRKQSEILHLMVANPGVTISKEQFFSQIWPEQYVEDGNLTIHIHFLRRILEQDPRNPSLILTVTGHGYKYVGEAVCLQDDNPQDAEPLPDEVSHITSPPPDSGKRGAWQPSSLKLWHLITIAAFAGLLALLIFILYPKPAADPPIAVPLTTLPGSERYPAISPDGNFIAFTWDGDDLHNDDIYVQQITGSKMVRVTNDPASDIQPVWSPDGLNLAFLRSGNAPGAPYQLIITSVFGGSRREVAQVYGGVDWSPDGQQLAVAGIAGVADEIGIYLISVDGKTRREVTRPDPNINSRDSSPRFSPDGKTIAFLRSQSDKESDLFIVNLLNGEVRQITRDQKSIQDGSLHWGPDGESIFYISNRSLVWNLYQTELNGDDPILVPWLMLPKFSFNLIRGSISFSLSRKGDIFVFTNELMDDRVTVYGSPGRPNLSCLINSTKSDASPQLSPDGSRLVFVSDRSGVEQLWTAKADCSEPSQLTNFTESGTANPRWSPDGSSIAFDYSRGETSAIYVIGVDGAGLRRVWHATGPGTFPFWSPSGDWIYFTSGSTGASHNWQIRKIRSNGAEVTQVTNTDSSKKWRPQVAPDGRTLYFTRTDRLWKKDLIAGTEEPVQELANLSLGRNWEVSSNAIYYYQTEVAMRSAIYKFDLTTRQTSRLATVEGQMDPQLQSLSVLDEGRRYAVSAVYIRYSDINLVRKWR